MSSCGTSEALRILLKLSAYAYIRILALSLHFNHFTPLFLSLLVTFISIKCS